MSALLCLLSIALLSSCTAQQWQTTTEVLAVTALVGVAVITSEPTLTVTRCRTVTHKRTIETVCWAH